MTIKTFFFIFAMFSNGNELPLACWHNAESINIIEQISDDHFVEEMSVDHENVGFIICTTDTFLFFDTASLIPFKIQNVFIESSSSTIRFNKKGQTLQTSILNKNGKETLLEIVLTGE